MIEREEPNDHVCKITALGTRLLFTQSGIAGNTNTKGGSNNWMGSTEAFRAFTHFQNSKANMDAVDQVSADWTKTMKAIYSRMLKLDRESGVSPYGLEDVLTRSVFIGLDPHGQVKVREIDISFDRGTFEKSGIVIISASNQLWDIASQMQYKAIGHIKISDEFANATSSRAMLDANYWKSEMNKPGSEELYAAHLVEVTEDYAPRDWGIGGAIDVVEMLPNEGVHWIRRKPDCPSDGVSRP